MMANKYMKNKCIYISLCNFNTVAHVVMTPNHKIIFIATLQVQVFSTVMNCNVNIYFPKVLGDSCERVF